MLHREADSGVRELAGGRILAPNDYVITLSVADYQKVSADPDLTSATFARHLEGYIHEQGWQTYGDVVVRFEQSANLHTGQFRARGAVNPDSTTGEPAPAQPDRAYTAEPGVQPMTDNPNYRGGQGQGRPDDILRRPLRAPRGAGRRPGSPRPVPAAAAAGPAGLPAAPAGRTRLRPAARLSRTGRRLPGAGRLSRASRRLPGAGWRLPRTGRQLSRPGRLPATAVRAAPAGRLRPSTGWRLPRPGRLPAGTGWLPAAGPAGRRLRRRRLRPPTGGSACGPTGGGPTASGRLRPSARWLSRPGRLPRTGRRLPRPGWRLSGPGLRRWSAVRPPGLRAAARLRPLR